MELDLPPNVELKLNRMVEEGEFETIEHAAKELLSSSIRAYEIGRDQQQEEVPFKEEIFNHNDEEYVF
jgi:hypothetical protein